MSVKQQAKEAALLEFRKAVLHEIHAAGYVTKGSLAAMFKVHRETISRIVDWLIIEELVRLVGSPVGCPYEAFGGGNGNAKTCWYTVTKVDIGKRHSELADGVLSFFVNTECLITEKKPMPRRFFCAQRTDCWSPPGEVKIKKEWVPIHRAGTHLAAVFIASSAQKMSDVDTVTLTSERVLRAAEKAIFPMSNGLFCIAQKGSPSFSCRIEFEANDIGSTRYRKYFEELKKCEFPTLYITLDDSITRSLTLAAGKQQGISAVTYGDEVGCQSAIRSLRNGW